MSVLESLGDAFSAHYGRAPRWIASAPGRLNLIGEHTDYNDGFVLPMAIEFRTAIAAAPNDSSRITLRSDAASETAVIELAEPLRPEGPGHWLNYPKGVLAGFAAAGYRPRGFDALIASSVPIGAGLSSSAALESATATLLEAVCAVELDPVRKALLCQHAEHTYAGVPVGIMDPFICILARRDQVLLLDCRSREAQWVPFEDPEVTVLAVNTNVKHRLLDGAYAERRRQCEAAARALGVRSLREADLEMLGRTTDLDELPRRRAQHVISEIARTLQAACCLRERDWPALGALIDASHASLRDDYGVSSPELDAVVEIAHSIGARGGVFGCRMTGGGFGGCAVALIAASEAAAIMSEIGAQYRRRTGIAATMFVSRPAAGAQLSTREHHDPHRPHTR
jgi:galactokinase